MRELDLVSSLIWVVVSALFCREAVALGLGELTEPGAGLFPFLMSSILLALSAGLFAVSLRRQGRFSLAEFRKTWPERSGLQRIWLTVLFLVGYIFSLNYLGFVLTT